jgi:hypothetical protein
MISLALLSSTGYMAAALIPTTTDRIAVWGLVALVVGLIVWREIRQPDFPSAGANSAPQLPAVQPLAAGVAPMPSAIPPVASTSPPPAILPEG